MKNKIIALLAFLAVPITNIQAQEVPEAKVFLQELVGEFKGRGEVIIGPTKSQERVSCKLNNSFDESGLMLAINGFCATTQGKVNVDGTLKMENENDIIGTFLSTSSNSEVTKSNSSFQDGTLTLSMSMVHKQTGNLSRTRQVVSRGEEGGFQSTFYRYDNASKSYLETGKVLFQASNPQ